MKTIKKVEATNTPLMDTLFRLNFDKHYSLGVSGHLLSFEDDLSRLVEEEIDRRSRVYVKVVE